MTRGLLLLKLQCVVLQARRNPDRVAQIARDQAKAAALVYQRSSLSSSRRVSLTPQRLFGTLFISMGSFCKSSTGATGHAEVVHITFDPTQISFETLLDVFWSTHDPTTLNQQGADVGTQYRSVIFYHDDTQKSSSEFKKQELEALEVYKNPVVTEILPFKHFSPAEERHQDYYQNNPNAPYCQIVISPKLQKLTEKYSKILK